MSDVLDHPAFQKGDVVLKDGYWYLVMDTWHDQCKTGKAEYPLLEDDDFLEDGWYRLTVLKGTLKEGLHTCYYSGLVSFKEWTGHVTDDHPAYVKVVREARKLANNNAMKANWSKLSSCLDELVNAVRKEGTQVGKVMYGPESHPSRSRTYIVDMQLQKAFQESQSLGLRRKQDLLEILVNFKKDNP